MFNNELWQKPAGGAGGSNFYDYQIANSCRFGTNTAASRLQRTPSSSGNRQKLTFSTWVKRSLMDTRQKLYICGEGVSYGYYSDIAFEGPTYGENKLYARLESGGTMFLSTQVFRDVSGWYHIVMAIDTTQADADDRCKVYVNGERITDWVTNPASTISQNYNTSYTWAGNGIKQTVGAEGLGNASEFNAVRGYMADTYLVDGTQLAIGDTGEFKNGVWIPKDPSGFTFGTNGFLLNYASASSLGNDVSGNNNDFTATSISAQDQTSDSPTFNSNSNGGNFSTWNLLSRTNPALSYGASTFTQGNLAFAGATGGTSSTGSTFSMQSGKWYAEVLQSGSTAGGFPALGVIYTDRMGSAQGTSNVQPQNGFTSFIAQTNGYVYKFDGSSGASYGSGFASGDICNIAVDIDAGKIWWGKNGTWFNSGNPSTGAYPGDTFTAGRDLSLWVGGYSGSGTSILNAGQEGTFAGAKTAQGNTDDTGYGNFYYTPKTIASGFLALCSGNLPIPASIDPAQTDDDFPKELFFMSQYTGNGTARTITTANQPDLMFLRHYTTGQDWYTFDSTRVITDNKVIITNTTAAESVLPQGNVTSVGATSVGINSSSWLNSGGSYYQMWMWRANGGTTSTNTQGDINSTVQVDPSGGFSIVKYTGTLSGTGTQTVGHGLSRAPSMFITKSITTTGNWWVFSDGQTSWNYGMNLQTDGASADKSGNGSMSAPTSTVFSTNWTDGLNETNKDMIAYCFANTEGYIKSDSYVGNSSDDGTFVYTGFRPAFVLNKPLVAGNWRQQDIKRSLFNVTQSSLSNNNNAAQDTGASVKIDLLSNGFKMRNSSTPWNQTTTFVYLAFAENPFKYATAR